MSKQGLCICFAVPQRVSLLVATLEGTCMLSLKDNLVVIASDQCCLAVASSFFFSPFEHDDEEEDDADSTQHWLQT